MRSIATVCGVGNIPYIPGTSGSAVGLGIAWILAVNPLYQAIGCAVAIALGFLSAGPTARQLGQTDPRQVVIDEVAGMMLGVALLPATWEIYLIGFSLFRLLDILKPWPLRRLERLPGSTGIMMDDLAAGAATHLILRFLY